MFLIGQNNKYGFCRYGRRCDKIHVTDSCALNEDCREKYCCEKIHPFRCYYFERLEDVNLDLIVNICILKIKKQSFKIK